jgi:hypothetical protein
MNEHSPRWLMRLPAGVYYCVLILFGIYWLVVYAWLVQGVLGLRGTTARVVAFCIAMPTGGPLMVLLVESPFRRFALKWERFADLQVAEEKVTRLLAKYDRSPDAKYLKRARRVVKKLRRIHPDPVYGQDLEDRVLQAYKSAGIDTS